jgi:hypothetical protein
MIELTLKDSKRLWGYIAVGPSDQCWPWLGACRNRKRGRQHTQFMLYHNHKCVNISPQRYIYSINYNDPAGYEVFMACKNSLCCNPSHMQLKEHAAICKIHALERPSGKITPAQKVEIYEACLRRENPTTLALKYGISKGYLKKIANQEARKRGVPLDAMYKIPRAIAEFVKWEHINGDSYSIIAKRHGIDPSTISLIVNNKYYNRSKRQ